MKSNIEEQALKVCMVNFPHGEIPVEVMVRAKQEEEEAEEDVIVAEEILTSPKLSVIVVTGMVIFRSECTSICAKTKERSPFSLRKKRKKKKLLY